MKSELTEETILFVSIIKWVILAICIGIIVGLSTTLFLKFLSYGTNLSSSYSYSFLLLPLALFSSSLLTKYIAPDAEGHGTEKVIEAIHKHSGNIKVAVVPVKLLATLITLTIGGSAGKEGPCAQIGAGLSSVFANLLKFDDYDRKKLVICGISAGFASVFGTPIAGAIFGVEVLFVGSIMYNVLLPSFIAGITSYIISSSLGLTYFYQNIHIVSNYNKYLFIESLFGGIFFGLCSVIFIEFLRFSYNLSKKIKVWMPLKGILGGIILILLTFIFSKKYLGLGLDTIHSCLKGESVEWYSFIIKTLFTSITLNFGGSGGIVTPIFFVGASSGILFAQIFNLNLAIFASLGFVSVLAGAANTPIAASIMAVEIFGPQIAPYATVACVISFLMTGHRSVFPSQILLIKKSPSLQVELGKELSNIHASYSPRKKSLFKHILKVIKTIEESLKKHI